MHGACQALGLLLYLVFVLLGPPLGSTRHKTLFPSKSSAFMKPP